MLKNISELKEHFSKVEDLLHNEKYNADCKERAQIDDISYNIHMCIQTLEALETLESLEKSSEDM
jgi:hypothetical protein